MDELLADLEQRSGFIDGVVVSGGEPTIDTGLPAFLRELKKRRLLVKLDTNGLRPDVIRRLLDEQLLDYVAVDLKTAPERYDELHPATVNSALLAETVRLLRQADLAYEFRTTCIPRLVTMREIRMMGELLRGVSLWILQQYHPQHALDPVWQQLEPYSPQYLTELATTARTYVRQVQIRGV